MIVVSSDWHPDASTAGFPRFDDVAAAVARSVDHAIEHRAEAYYFLGDLVTNDPPLDVMIRCLGIALKTAEELNGAGIASFWLTGNHDVFEDGRGTSVLDPIYYSSRAFLCNGPSLESFSDERRVLVLPFAATSRGYDPIKFVESIPQDENVVMVATHLMLEGISPGSETDEFPRGRDVFFPIDLVRERWPNAVVVAGHYHRRQVYRGVHVVGSLARLTRGERDNEPGFFVVDA